MYKKLNIFVKLLLIISSTLVASEIHGQSDSSNQLILEGIDYASTLEYEKAIKVFDKLVKLEPNNPRGYFLKSATYFWIFSTDMHNEAMGDTLKEWSLKAIDLAENILDKNENNIDALFYLGGSYGTLGRYYGLTKSYLKAYWYGQKGKNYLEEVIERDSTYYDAYLGLGIYHYLADVLPKFVKILSFILGVDGDKDLGIKELNIAAEKGLFTKTEAMFFLGAIYTYREQQYEKAIAIFNKLLEKYPDNCGALIHLGRCYSYMGKCDLALQTFFKILNSGEKQNRIPISSLHYQMGEVYFKMNNYYSAIGSYTIAVESDTSSKGNRRWTYSWSLYKLGLCYEIIGKRDRAEYYYNLVAEENNERAFNRAQEKLNKPLDEVEIAITKYRNYNDCGSHDIALESFMALHSKLLLDKDNVLNGNLSEVNYYIGKIKFDIGQIDESIMYLQKVIESKGTEEKLKYWAHFYLGNCYKNKGKIENAIEQYDLAGESEELDLINRINIAIQDITDNK